MGAMVTFDCPGCGYATDTLLLGPGPFPETFDPVLVSCDGCKTVRALDRGKAAKGCRKHRRAFTRVAEDAADCPRCGVRLSLQPVGLWD